MPRPALQLQILSRRATQALLVAVAATAMHFATSPALAVTLEWVRQFGTSVEDSEGDVSADGLGNVYVAGRTNGSLGAPNAGERDAFVAKYDADGNVEWTMQLGTSATDTSFGVSADGSGNVYISGTTGGSLGGPNAGLRDAFVAKYDAAGNFQWATQFGSSDHDQINGVSADRLGYVFVTGSTYGSLGGPNAGDLDAFVAKCDATGNVLWTKQFGTSVFDSSNGVSTDGLGNVYISGFTAGSLGGPNAGNWDSFVAKGDEDGNFQWIRQLGSSAFETNGGVSADRLGAVYISGATEGGSLGGPNAGVYDAFIAKYKDAVPEPNALALAAPALAFVFRRIGSDRRRGLERDAGVRTP